MKKILLIGLVLGIIGMMGCESSTKKTNSNTTSDNPIEINELISLNTDQMVSNDFTFSFDNQGILTITPLDLSVNYKYQLVTSRSAGSGSIGYNGLSSGNGSLSMSSAFSGEKSFEFNFETAGDIFEIEMILE